MPDGLHRESRVGVRGPEQQKTEFGAILQAGEVLRSRLFIAPTVKRLRVTERWNEASRLADHDDLDGFSLAAGKLLDEIREAAVSDLNG